MNQTPPTQPQTRMPTCNTPEEGNVGITRGNSSACVIGEWLCESLEKYQEFQNIIQQPMNMNPDQQEEAFETISHQEVNKL
jgi:hypothetical protein